ncbi:YqgE/AlgH family protein [Maricaulis parjimensis]|uniref:YqgE/AlgH family protein n=1 Tax=Maricaulis parjimensis TaxID=144023 RepID=UPI00193A1440
MQSDRPTDVDDSFLAGKILVATPSIGDPRFDRSVILMCDHSAEHAMGIVINKPIEGIRLPELLEQLDIEACRQAPDRPVLLGGPVDRDRGFVIHTTDYMTPESSLPVCPGLALTATKDVLEAIASPHPPRRSLMALGYAGWGAGQLEDELTANAWLVTEPDAGLIFDTPDSAKWERALDLLGVTPEHLSALTGHA